MLATIKNKVLSGISAALAFLKKWNELWFVTILLLAWPFVQVAFYILDPTSKVMDAGVLGNLYLALVMFASLNAAIWIGIKLNMPVIYSYLDSEFADDFKVKIKPWERIKFSLLYFFSFFLLAALCLIAVSLAAG